MTDAVAAVEFKIGAAVVTAHDAMTVTTTVTPATCVMSGSAVQSASSGVATYSGVTFTGHIGVCTMTFVGKFTSTGTPASTNQHPAAVVRTVIASSMIFDGSLSPVFPATTLVGGTGYTFTGVVLCCARAAASCTPPRARRFERMPCLD